MSDDLKNPGPDPEDPAWTPASPVKRTWAWVGAVYVILSLLLMVWFLATGTFLRGMGGLMLSPVLAGLSLTELFWFKTQKSPTRRLLNLVLAAAAALGVIGGLVSGIPALLAQL